MHTHHHPNRALSQKELEVRRFRAAPYFRKGWSERTIGKKIGVSSIAVHQWKVVWQKEGVKGLRARHYGHPTKLSPKKEHEVKKKILEGAGAHGFPGDYWTLSRITQAVSTWTHVTYEDRSIWHLLRRLGFSCQKPVRRAVERDEKSIRTWTKEIWPQIKKGASKTA